MTNYAKSVNRTATKTPQNRKARADQVKNSAGGYTFALDKWDRLDRFLILGADSGTYYVGRNVHLNNNYESVIECVAPNGARAPERKASGLRAVERIVEISKEGRAPKNAPAVFALAVAAAFGVKATKEAAFRAMPSVARTATDFFNFIDQYKTLGGGFGIVARKGIEAWYSGKEVSQAAYQIIKYRQREGWTHLDALRLAHVKPRTEVESNLYAFAKTLAGKNAKYKENLLPEMAQGYLKVQRARTSTEVATLVRDHNLPREAVPTNFLNDVEVWEALLERMPATALVRNLGKMTQIGLIGPNTNGAKIVERKLNDDEWLRKARMHPVTVLNALSVYKRGHGVLGSLSWNPARRVIDGLDAAFYGTFKHVEPTGKRTLLALDVSGSMGFTMASGGFQLSPREIVAAMSMATAKVEKDYEIVGFSHQLREIDISPRQRLDDVIRTMSSIPMGSTDCSLPMVWAEKNGLVFDTFIVYTDNETWSGRVHPFEALKSYRRKVNPEAKLVVCATASSGFSIADPNDAGMLDIVGFDSSAPELIANFAKD